jgi:(4S)-4-hydroxy-5-phosphonooxypentane-2,3-dione isomerase
MSNAHLAGHLADHLAGQLAVLVQVHVLSEAADAFRTASLANAAASIREPGVVRFDVIQEAADPTRFVLIEVYRDADGATAHKQTPHYQAWRDAVSPMMAEPRTSKSYCTVTSDLSLVSHGKNCV